MLNTVLRKRIIFIVLHLFTLLLLAEIACRVKYYLASDDPGYLFSPFIDVQFIQQQKNAPPPTKTAEIINSDTINKDTLLYSPCRDSLLLKTYNDYGWPGPQIAETKPEEIFRILVVGGSTVESPYNGNIDTWCYRLGKLLNKKPSLEAKVEVINAGKAGGNVFRIHKRLKQNGFRLNPDMILYYEAGNDMTEVNS